ncbi:MAG: DUF3301 domain-containing protein [Kangiellaceae bacterium]|nr:DUF3301 domain-containing protein [Kangiellaceae bacterium]
MSKVITLLSIIGLVWYWSYSQKIKQLALRASINRCKEAGVQFLDHSVVLHKIRFRKNNAGQWKLMREYRFEFTSTGENRYIGRVVMQAHHLVSSELEPYSLN